MTFFQLMHIYEGSSPKDIGYFSSLSNLQKAKNILREKPGFCNYKDGFIVIKKSSPNVHLNKPFFESLVYYHTADFSVEYSSTLGFFENEQEAESAIKVFESVNLSDVPSFAREMIVNKCILNKVMWSDGFIPAGNTVCK